MEASPQLLFGWEVPKDKGMSQVTPQLPLLGQKGTLIVGGWGPKGQENHGPCLHPHQDGPKDPQALALNQIFFNDLFLSGEEQEISRQENLPWVPGETQNLGSKETRLEKKLKVDGIERLEQLLEPGEGFVDLEVVVVFVFGHQPREFRRRGGLPNSPPSPGDQWYHQGCPMWLHQGEPHLQGRGLLHDTSPKEMYLR